MHGFDDPAAVARYADNPPRLVPGFAAMQRMALILLEERAPPDASVLVVGAGGGLELKVFAEAEPDWRFTGVDPSAEMLGLATRILGPLAARVELCQGTIETAPEGPFDAATAILVLHFIPEKERLDTLMRIHARLKPGAPLVVVHHSVAGEAESRKHWFDRFAAFAIASGVAADNARNAASALPEKLPILAPEQDEDLIRQAGFSSVSLFYAAFTFRGWVGYA